MTSHRTFVRATKGTAPTTLQLVGWIVDVYQEWYGRACERGSINTVNEMVVLPQSPIYTLHRNIEVR